MAPPPSRAPRPGRMLAVVTGLIVGLRILERIIHDTGFYLDDYMIVFSYVREPPFPVPP